MHPAGYNYRNSSFIVDVAMGQIPRSTERISSYNCHYSSSILTTGDNTFTAATASVFNCNDNPEFCACVCPVDKLWLRKLQYSCIVYSVAYSKTKTKFDK